MQVVVAPAQVDRASPAPWIKARFSLRIASPRRYPELCNPDHLDDPCDAHVQCTEDVAAGDRLLPGGLQTMTCDLGLVPEGLVARDLVMRLQPSFSGDAFTALQLQPPPP